MTISDRLLLLIQNSMTSWRDFEPRTQRDDMLFSTSVRGSASKMESSRSESMGSRLESTEETVHRLDSEFDQMLADMKPHVLRLPHKAGIH